MIQLGLVGGPVQSVLFLEHVEGLVHGDRGLLARREGVVEQHRGRDALAERHRRVRAHAVVLSGEAREVRRAGDGLELLRRSRVAHEPGRSAVEELERRHRRSEPGPEVGGRDLVEGRQYGLDARARQLRSVLRRQRGVGEGQRQ